MGPRDNSENSMRLIIMLYILKMLCQGPAHSSELVKEINRRTKDVFTLNPHIIYPLIEILGDLGYIGWECNNPNGRGKRLYSITEDGISSILELEAMAQYYIAQTERKLAVVRTDLLQK